MIDKAKMCEILSEMNYLIGFTKGMMQSEDELNASNAKEINKRLNLIYIGLISD